MIICRIVLTLAVGFWLTIGEAQAATVVHYTFDGNANDISVTCPPIIGP